MLYSLCADYPEHTDPEVVVAKLWLIGRAYAAPLERGRRTPRAPKNESFYTGVAVPAILSSSIDGWLHDLAGADLTWDDLPLLLRTHRRLTDLFRAISGKSQRSLASKYLHFHRPELFFIYDSRADAAARVECSDPRALELEKKDADPAYALFARRCLELIPVLQDELAVRVTPRVLDRYLLEY